MTKRTIYVICSEDNELFLHKMYDFDGGKNYTAASFDKNWRFSQQFYSVKTAKFGLDQLSQCKPSYGIYNKLNYNTYYSINKLPKMKIIKIVIEMGDI